MAKVMVIFSGGLDSGTLLYSLADEGHEVMALGIDYGQRHDRELSYAKKFCATLGLPYPTLDMRSLAPLLPGSSQTDRSIPVPHGHYQAENMKATVVPNRNMLLLAAAGAVAIAHRCSTLAYGAHGGDHAIYPDCRPEFIEVMQRAFTLCDWSPLALVVPFAHWTKAQIVERGLALKVPYELTWTCYQDDETPCGKCGSCLERAEAFAANGCPDPLLSTVTGMIKENG